MIRHNLRNRRFESRFRRNEDFEFEWEEYQTGVKGSFMKSLAHAFDLADSKNLRKLASAFPEIYEIYKEFHGDVLKKFESKRRNETKCTNDLLEEGKTYYLESTGFGSSLGYIEDGYFDDLTDEEMKRLEDAGWIINGEVIIPDEEPFTLVKRRRYGDDLYFPSVDVTFTGLVGDDDGLYVLVE